MRRLTLAPVAIAVLVHAAAASSEEQEEFARWLPSFGFSSGVIFQRAEGSHQSNLRPPEDELDPPGPFPGTPAHGSDQLVDPPVVFTGEIMTPGIESLPGSPRLFAHGDLGAIFGSEVILAGEGSPGSFVLPPDVIQFSSLAVEGQGAQTSAENKPLVAGGGLGVAFSTSILGRRVRVKPSFEYLRHEVEVNGVLHHVSGDRHFTPPPNPVLVDTLMFFAFESQEERTLDSIGGGLELELDTLRAGPFMISLLVSGQIYRVVGDRDIHLSASDGTNAVRWDATFDRELYRASAGMRFRLFPEF